MFRIVRNCPFVFSLVISVRTRRKLHKQTKALTPVYKFNYKTNVFDQCRDCIFENILVNLIETIWYG